MLAANRTDRVNGRITFLTNSIITIKGIKIGGVPSGTKWVIVELGSQEFLNKIWPSQRGMAKAQAKVKCADDVKIKGNRPLKLFKLRKEKSLRGIMKIPGEENLALTADSSEITEVHRF